MDWELIEKTNPSPEGERGLGSKAVSLGFAIQAAESKKGHCAQPEEGTRRGLGNHAWGADGGGTSCICKSPGKTHRRGREVGRILGGGTPVVPNKRIGGNPSPSNARVVA